LTVAGHRPSFGQGIASGDVRVDVDIFGRESMAARKKSAKAARGRAVARKRRAVRRKVGRRKAAVRARVKVRKARARAKARVAVSKAKRSVRKVVRKATRVARSKVRAAGRGARSAIRSTAKNVRSASRSAERAATDLVTAAATKVEQAAVAVDQSLAEPRPTPASAAAQAA
jgi:hypothetical protein